MDSLSLVAQSVKNLPAMQETWVQSLGWENPLEKGKATHSSILGLSLCSAGKEFACNEGDLGSIPGLGKSPGEGKGYPLQYSGLENSIDYIVHGVTKSWTQLSEFPFHRINSSQEYCRSNSSLLRFAEICDEDCLTFFVIFSLSPRRTEIMTYERK